MTIHCTNVYWNVVWNIFRTVCFSSDDSCIASGSADSVKIWSRLGSDQLVAIHVCIQPLLFSVAPPTSVYATYHLAIAYAQRLPQGTDIF